MNRILLFVVFSFFFSGLTAQYRVEHLTDSVLYHGKGGIVYCLPQAGLNVDIQLTSRQESKGPYADFAKDYLNLERPVQENSMKYAIEAVTLHAYPVPDPTQYYYLSRSGLCSLIGRKPSLTLNLQGFPLSMNIPIREKSHDRHACILPEPRVVKETTRLIPAYHLNPAIFKLHSRDTASLVKLVLRVKASDDPLTKKARDAAEQLAKIRENKINLMSGYQEIAYEPGSLDLMIRGLEEEEARLVSLFNGSSTNTVSHIALNIVPTANDTFPIVLGHFDAARGFTTLPGAPGERVTMEILPGRELEQFIPLEKKKKKKEYKGFAYRIPVTATIHIRVGSRPILEQEVLLPQLGATGRLSKKVKKVLFDPETGSILKAR